MRIAPGSKMRLTMLWAKRLGRDELRQKCNRAAENHATGELAANIWWLLDELEAAEGKLRAAESALPPMPPPDHDVPSAINWWMNHERVLDETLLRAQMVALSSRTQTHTVTTGEWAAATWRLLDKLETLAAEGAALQETVDGYRAAMTNVTADAPHNGTETSKKAARAIAPRMAGQRYIIFQCMMKAGSTGCTADELERRCKMTGNSIRPRLNEMAELGWVRRTNDTRKTRAGGDAVIWVTTQPGHEMYRKTSPA